MDFKSDGLPLAIIVWLLSLSIKVTADPPATGSPPITASNCFFTSDGFS